MTSPPSVANLVSAGVDEELKKMRGSLPTSRLSSPFHVPWLPSPRRPRPVVLTDWYPSVWRARSSIRDGYRKPNPNPSNEKAPRQHVATAGLSIMFRRACPCVRRGPLPFHRRQPARARPPRESRAREEGSGTGSAVKA